MAKIADRVTKDSSGGYERVFGNAEIGALMSKVHGTVISAGSELEKIIKSKVPLIGNLDEFLEQEIMPDGVLLASKQQIKECKTIDTCDAEPDFLIFKRRQGKQNCYVVELKDGHAFDTKKSRSERGTLHNFTQRNAQHIQYRFRVYVCCFNQESRENIYSGFKQKISREEILTGREFCELLEINYDEIVEARTSDQQDNLLYFLNELARIPVICRRFQSLR